MGAEGTDVANGKYDLMRTMGIARLLCITVGLIETILPIYPKGCIGGQNVTSKTPVEIQFTLGEHYFVVGVPVDGRSGFGRSGRQLAIEGSQLRTYLINRGIIWRSPTATLKRNNPYLL